MKAPTIIIPGTQGTKLANINKKNFDTVWSGIRKFFDNLYDIILDIDGRTDKQKEVIIERQDVEDLAYSEIINFLKSKGYPVYIFGYDWRKSNVDTGKELLSFVEGVRKKHRGNARINFVTHSMGCLVFSGFLRHLTENKKKTYINRAIFTVPPFLGSVEAIFNLVIGKSKLFNSSDDFRKIARTFPSIFELCPIYKDAVIPTSGNTPFNLYDYNCWQQSHDPDIINLYEVRLAELKKVRDQGNFMYDLGSLDEEIRQRLLIVIGTGEETQRQIKFDPNSTPIKNLFIFDKVTDEEGDGTVHLKSADIFKDAVTTITVRSRWIEKRLDGHMFLADWHSFFLNNGRVQNIIKRFFEQDLTSLQTDDKWFRSTKGDEKKL